MPTIIYREATQADIPAIQIVRNAVKENTLSDPSLVSDADCADYLTRRGKGWVCEVGGRVVGFAIVDLQQNNVWALFLLPEMEGRGIGRTLHGLMMDWYFEQTDADIWLGTMPATRAAAFYQMAGWEAAGLHGQREIKFTMTKEAWIRKKTDRLNKHGAVN